MEIINNPLGWEDLDPKPDANQSQFNEEIKEQFRLNQLIYKIFNSKDGKVVLKWLQESTVGSATWIPSIAMQYGMEAATAHGFAREGQNALVKEIERRMMIAEKCKTPEDLHLFNKPKEY